jgi:peptide/nickel transport system ATP-binding protein
VPEPLLSVRGLAVDYITAGGAIRAVDRVSFDIAGGEILGLAGESGSGKSTLAQAILRILPPPAVISGGEILFEGRDLLALDETGLQALRWKRIAMVFQSAMSALNPVIPIGEQIEDAIQAHESSSRAERQSRVRDLLAMVGISPERAEGYAHQLSGGMRQRVSIAMALALHPALLILDEPTTALDVLVERDILDQIRELRDRLGFAVLFITHDLGRMLQFSDRVVVLYAARLAELAPSEVLRTAPRHPYTQGLLRAFPSLRGHVTPVSIPGTPPSLRTPPSGCRFHPRCCQAIDVCREREPKALAYGEEHVVACHVVERQGP